EQVLTAGRRPPDVSPARSRGGVQDSPAPWQHERTTMPDAVSRVLDDYARGAAQRLGRDTRCGIILLRAGTLVSVGSSDERAARCDGIEAEDGVGLCVTAAEQLSSVIIPDLRLD